MDNQNQAPPQREAPPQAAQEKNQPADVTRDGNLKATTWRNEGENGPYYSTTFARSYQDENGKFHDSHSFSGSELLRISELARGAYARSNELRREQAQEVKRDQPQSNLDLEQKPKGTKRSDFRAKRESNGTRSRRTQRR